MSWQWAGRQRRSLACSVETGPSPDQEGAGFPRTMQQHFLIRTLSSVSMSATMSHPPNFKAS